MNETKHTPGPWTHAPLGAGLWVTGPNGEQVAVVYGPTVNPASAANAALIDGAPALFRALLELAEYAEHDSGCPAFSPDWRTPAIVGGLCSCGLAEAEQLKRQALAQVEGRS